MMYEEINGVEASAEQRDELNRRVKVFLEALQDDDLGYDSDSPIVSAARGIERLVFALPVLLALAEAVMEGSVLQNIARNAYLRGSTGTYRFLLPISRVAKVAYKVLCESPSEDFDALLARVEKAYCCAEDDWGR